uniref:Uncharacterized protein n=1 Tax=Arundo donax TaxID=35708 RepID=A0A0A9TFL4_ARUDO
MATTDSSKSTRTVITCFLLPLRPPCISDAVSDQLHLHTPRATKKMKPTRMWPGP